MATIFHDSHLFEVKEFYSYPTSIVNRIAEYDEGFHPGGDEEIKELFDILLENTEITLNKSLRDNKIAMKVIYKPTGTEMYVGYKDWNWCVGLSLNPYMTGKKLAIPE